MEPSAPTSAPKQISISRLLYLVNHCRGFLPTRDEWEEVIKLINELFRGNQKERDAADQLAGALEWSMSPEYDEYMDPYYEDHPTVVIGKLHATAGMVRAARAALAAYRAEKVAIT